MNDFRLFMKQCYLIVGSVEKLKKVGNRRIMLSKCAFCAGKTSGFIKDQEARDFLTGLFAVKSLFEGSTVLGNII